MCLLHQVNESKQDGDMKMKSIGKYSFLLVCVLISGDAAHLFGANMRSFIESVRRKAPVVYVGSVKEVRVLQRTKFDIKATAVVDIKAVKRTPGSSPHQATIEYSSFDEKTPMLEGDPSIPTATWRFGDRFCQLLRRHYSAWISRAGQPPGVDAAG
jgi:hypothetical protein